MCNVVATPEISDIDGSKQSTCKDNVQHVGTPEQLVGTHGVTQIKASVLVSPFKHRHNLVSELKNATRVQTKRAA